MAMQDIFRLVKEISAVSVARQFGVDLQRKGKHYRGLCPFHTEKDASFYEYRNRFKCFGCAWSGDAVDLVAKLRNVSSLDAAKLIAQSFGKLLDEPLTPAAREQARHQARQRAKEKAAELLFNQQVNEAARRLELLFRTTETTLARGGLEAYIELSDMVQRLPAWEHLLNCLKSRNMELQAKALLSEEVRP